MKTDDKYILKSKGRRLFRIGFAVILIGLLLTYGLRDNSTVMLIFAAAIAFSVFIELIIHEETIIELTAEKMKVRISKLSGTIKDNYEIPLSEIQSRFFERKRYDGYGLAFHTLWELYFPTNKSQLTIHLEKGRKKEIPLNVSDLEAKNLISKIPERIPNF
ncbi:hypothetical protein [Brumimicrobium aurantiacum]|uniref:hypothetical protein n=1 Tax=Brumimicrobium aurantiacum TaxID=1737063 RepID=UPI000F4EA128|nr:hypothetical protein [Brumimicrobium aurantiacum]